MELPVTFLISCVLLLIAFGFGALLGFNLIEGADTRRKPKLYEYRYKPVNLTLSEAEVRARIRDLADEKEATSVRALLKGRSGKPVQRVTAGLGPILDKEPEAGKSPIAFTAVPETSPKALADDDNDTVVPSAEVINLGQRRTTGLVFYRVDDKGNTNYGLPKIAPKDRPPVSILARMTPEAVASSVVQIGNGHEPHRLESPDGPPNELNLISGISDTHERALNRLGIFHFWQIASWTPEHVAWVSARLPEGERIARENWMAQAYRLIDAPVRVFNIDDDTPPKA